MVEKRASNVEGFGDQTAAPLTDTNTLSGAKKTKLT